jgi:hypothetical protein
LVAAGTSWRQREGHRHHLHHHGHVNTKARDGISASLR